MKPMDCRKTTRSWCILPCLLALMVFVSSARTGVSEETLDLPLPRTSTNAALHYQRAILFLVAVDPVHRDLLRKPIWEIVNPTSSPADLAKVDRLLIASRHAIRSSLIGANQLHADFGLDIRQYMLTAVLPHTQMMVDLAKLNALHGVQKEAAGDWTSAAEIYLAIIRMGRHMTHQTTLDEVLAGIEILETAYYALGRWATHCSDESLINRLLDLAKVSSGNLIEPARTLLSEASISQMRLDAMQDAYPDGPWAEMVLEVLHEEMPNVGPVDLRKHAIAAAIKHGVPKSAFDNKDALGRHLKKLRSTHIALTRESAICLTQSAPESILQGETIYQKYKSKLPDTERASKLNPARLASLFAVHKAELTLTKVILAISATKTAQGFPADLGSVAEKLGGTLPKSPYDGSALVYESLENGKGFSLTVSGTTIGKEKLPEIEFKHLPSASSPE